MGVCVYSEWVSQEGFWSETHRSSGFEGDHPSTVSVAWHSTQYVCVHPPVCFFLPLHIKGEFSTTFLARSRHICARAQGQSAHPVRWELNLSDQMHEMCLTTFKRDLIFTQNSHSSLRVAAKARIQRTPRYINGRRDKIPDKEMWWCLSRWLLEIMPTTYKWGDWHRQQIKKTGHIVSARWLFLFFSLSNVT